MHTLLFMGEHEEHDIRCRVYDGTSASEVDPRLAFLRTCASEGAVDCQAYDRWVEALQQRSWLPERPELQPNPDGPGKIGRWRLTQAGLDGLAQIEAARA